jgi:hypothetical protein
MDSNASASFTYFFLHPSRKTYLLISPNWLLHPTALIGRPTAPYGPHSAHIRPLSSLHPASIRPPFGLHPASIRPPSGLHPASIRPPSGHHSAHIRPPFGPHSASVRPRFGLDSASIRPPFGLLHSCWGLRFASGPLGIGPEPELIPTVLGKDNF